MGILRRSKQRTDAFLLARPAGSLLNFKESSKRACLQANLKVVLGSTCGRTRKWQDKLGQFEPIFFHFRKCYKVF
jgi:hypothetical protein